MFVGVFDPFAVVDTDSVAAVFAAYSSFLDDVLGFGPGWQVAFRELVRFPVDGHVDGVHAMVFFPYMVLYQAAASAPSPRCQAVMFRSQTMVCSGSGVG